MCINATHAISLRRASRGHKVVYNPGRHTFEQHAICMLYRGLDNLLNLRTSKLS